MLRVVSVAATLICIPAAADDGTPVMDVAVTALVIVIESALEALPL